MSFLFLFFFLVHVIAFHIGKCVMSWRVVRGLKEFLWSSVESPFRIGKLVLRAFPVVLVLVLVLVLRAVPV